MQSTLGVGRCSNVFFGYVLVAVRQGQRRDAVATGEEQLGRCAAGQSKYLRLYLYCGKLIFAATYLRRVFVDGRSFAAGQSLTRPKLEVLSTRFEIALQCSNRFKKRIGLNRG